MGKGNKSYHKSEYEAAEQYYKEALRPALINLNVLYGEKLHKFPESVEINRQLIKIDDSLEAKTNLVESLLRVGNYEEARKYASEVMNTREDQHKVSKRYSLMLYPSALDYEGYQTINIFFIICSYLLEGDITNGRKELGNFLNHIRRSFEIGKEQWIFEGLAKSVDDSRVNDEIKEVILTIIKLLQGKISKDDAKRKIETFLQP